MSDIEHVDKSSFLKHFEELRPDFFLKEIYEAPEDRLEAQEALRTKKTKMAMFATIPMKCTGPQCMFAQECPLLKKGIAPIGKKCPVEMQMVSDFMQNLMMDLNVDPENMVEVCMVRDLVDQEIQHVRKSQWQSNEGLTQEQVIGLDNENRPVIREELHLSVELEDKILKRKNQIRKELLASREARAKAGQGAIDSAQVISKMFEELREIDSSRERAKRERLGMLGFDAYIESQEKVIDAEVVEEEDGKE